MTVVLLAALSFSGAAAQEGDDNYPPAPTEAPTEPPTEPSTSPPETPGATVLDDNETNEPEPATSPSETPGATVRNDNETNPSALSSTGVAVGSLLALALVLLGSGILLVRLRHARSSG